MSDNPQEAPAIIQPLSAFRAMVSLISAAGELLRGAEGIAADARLDDYYATTLTAIAYMVDDEVLSEAREDIEKLEAEARS